MANVLKRNGVKKGDRLCIYMPMVPELAVTVLPCVRVGAIHSVVFSGFSAQSIADRINDAACSEVINSATGPCGEQVDSDEKHHERCHNRVLHRTTRNRADAYPYARVHMQRPRYVV